MQKRGPCLSAWEQSLNLLLSHIYSASSSSLFVPLSPSHLSSAAILHVHTPGELRDHNLGSSFAQGSFCTAPVESVHTRCRQHPRRGYWEQWRAKNHKEWPNKGKMNKSKMTRLCWVNRAVFRMTQSTTMRMQSVTFWEGTQPVRVVEIQRWDSI